MGANEEPQIYLQVRQELLPPPTQVCQGPFCNTLSRGINPIGDGSRQGKHWPIIHYLDHGNMHFLEQGRD